MGALSSKFDIELILGDTRKNCIIEKWFINCLDKYKNSEDVSFKASEEMKKDYCDYFASRGFKGVSSRWMEHIYSINGRYDKRYIPDDIFNMYIDPFFPDFRDQWQNKAYQPLLLPNVTFPHTLVLCKTGVLFDEQNNIVDEASALSILRRYDRVVFKPAIYTGGGAGIKFVDTKKLTPETLRCFGSDRKPCTDFIVQEILEQSELMAKFNPTSVNTDKILSFFFKNEVHILAAHVRMGQKGSEIDNVSDNIYNPFVGVHPDGTLDKLGITIGGVWVDRSPSGMIFENTVLDFHQKCLDIIRESHKTFPQFPIISWDFAQRKDGTPILMEYNLKCHSVFHYQYYAGPLFGDLTDDVLIEAAKKRDENHGLMYRFR